MKKATGTLLAICILFLMTGAMAAPGDAMLFTREQRSALGISEISGYTISMAAVNDTLYTLCGSSVYSWQPGQEMPVMMGAGFESGYYATYEEAQSVIGDKADTMITSLVAGGGTLYGLNRLNGKLFPVTFQNGQTLLENPVQLDWTGMEVTQDSYTYTKDANRMAIDGNNLYAMIRNNDDYYKPEFASFDLMTGSKHVYDVDFVQDFTPYQDGKLLLKIYDMENAYSDGEEPKKPTVSVFDPASGELFEAGTFGDANVFGMAYQKETDTLFYTTNSKLMAMKSLSGAAQVAFLPVDYADEANAAILPGGLYAINTWNGLIVRNTDPSYMPASSLSIYNGYLDETAMAFTVMYPQVPLTFNQNVYFDSMEALAQAMVSGDNKFDVYNYDISYQDFQGLMNKGYCADLSLSEKLQSEILNMYPFLQNAVGKDGKFYALPTYIYASGLSYAPEIWEVAGLLDRLPTSFLGLLDFMDWWLQEGQAQHPGLMLMDNVYDYGENLFQMALSMYVYQCQAEGQELSLNTPEFKNVLAALENLDTEALNDTLPSESDLEYGMISRKAIAAGGDISGQALFMNYGDWLNVQGSRGMMVNAIPLVLPLVEGGASHIPVYVQVLFVNPNTDNMDMALKYLENALDHMNTSQHVMMFPNDNEPVPMKYYEEIIAQWEDELEKASNRLQNAKPEEKKDLENQVEIYQNLLDRKDDYYWEVSAEGIAQYRELTPLCFTASPNLLSYRAKDGSSDIETLIQRYRQKQMSLDQFLQEADKKIRMILLERQ